MSELTPCPVCNGSLFDVNRAGDRVRCPRCSMVLDIYLVLPSGPYAPDDRMDRAIDAFEELECWSKGEEDTYPTENVKQPIRSADDASPAVGGGGGHAGLIGNGLLNNAFQRLGQIGIGMNPLEGGGGGVSQPAEGGDGDNPLASPVEVLPDGTYRTEPCTAEEDKAGEAVANFLNRKPRP